MWVSVAYGLLGAAINWSTRPAATGGSAHTRRGKTWLRTQHSENYDHDIQFHHFMANRWRNNVNRDFLGGAPKSQQMVTAAMKLKDAYSSEGTL